MRDMKGRFLKALAIHLKDLRFLVIDPNGGMSRHAGPVSEIHAVRRSTPFALTAPIPPSDRFDGTGLVAGDHA